MFLFNLIFVLPLGSMKARGPDKNLNQEFLRSPCPSLFLIVLMVLKETKGRVYVPRSLEMEYSSRATEG